MALQNTTSSKEKGSRTCQEDQTFAWLQGPLQESTLQDLKLYFKSIQVLALRLQDPPYKTESDKAQHTDFSVV